jgi:hypothetical protein
MTHSRNNFPQWFLWNQQFLKTKFPRCFENKKLKTKNLKNLPPQESLSKEDLAAIIANWQEQDKQDNKRREAQRERRRNISRKRKEALRER